MATEIHQRLDQIVEKMTQRTATLKEFKEFNALLDELLQQFDDSQTGQITGSVKNSTFQ